MRVRYQLTERAAQRFREEADMEFPFSVKDVSNPSAFINGTLRVYGLRISRTERGDDPEIDCVFYIDVNNHNRNGSHNGNQEPAVDFFDAYVGEGWIVPDGRIRKDKHARRMERRSDRTADDDKMFSDVARSADEVYAVS